MPPLTFIQLQDRTLVEAGYPRIETDATDTELLFNTKRFINQAYEDIWKRRPWTWMEEILEFSTVAQINAGTISVTQGSQTATLSTTVGTDPNKLIGRILVVASVAYRIRSATSGTVFELDHPYRGTTNTSATYQIVQAEYTLPWDLDTILKVRNYDLVDPLTPILDPFDSETRIRINTPRWYYFVGHKFKNTYAVGTIAASANATDETGTITGVATTFSADGRVEVGDTILVYGTSGGAGGTAQITNFPYRIRTIVSDLSLTVEPGIKEAFSAGTLFEVKPRRSPTIIFFDWPDSIVHYEIKFRRRLPPLVADTDFPECPDEFHDLLVLRAKALHYERKGAFDQAQAANTEYQFALSELEFDDPVDQHLDHYPISRNVIGL